MFLKLSLIVTKSFVIKNVYRGTIYDARNVFFKFKKIKPSKSKYLYQLMYTRPLKYFSKMFDRRNNTFK